MEDGTAAEATFSSRILASFICFGLQAKILCQMAVIVFCDFGCSHLQLKISCISACSVKSAMPPGTSQKRGSGAESQDAQVAKDTLPTVEAEQEEPSKQEAAGPALPGGVAMQAINGYLGKPLGIHVMVIVKARSLLCFLKQNRLDFP